MNPFNPFILLSLLFSILYFTGVLFFLTDYELNKCLMTYMYEYPQFVRISQNNLNRPNQKYGLYAYSEGKLTSKVRDMKFDGIPVIFLPGNAGSHKQVRSLSSVALRIALNSRMPYHFDYFTVDFNEEWSGIYGPLLTDQLIYVNGSINRVLQLYKSNKNAPTSVILIGHSMGGVIAKKLLSLLPPESDLVSVLITLAAPLKQAPVYFDKSMYEFYNIPKCVSHYETTIINLSGGYSDFLIPPELTNIQGEVNYSLNAVTTNIPKSWVEANHVKILWCKQTVIALNRALFDIVNIKTKQISPDPNYRMTVFHHHLVHNSGIKIRNFNQYQETMKIDYRGQWIEDIRRQYTVNLAGGLKEPHWYMVSFTFQPNYEILTVLAVNLEVTDWAFACSAAYPKGPSKVCVEGQHLSQFSEIAPSARFKRRLLTINMHELKRSDLELTHVVFRALPTTEMVLFHVDVYKESDRRIEIKLPTWWSLGKTIIIEETNERAIRYDLELSELSHILQYYQLFVEPIRCSIDSYHATASLSVPWANHDIHAHFTESEKKPMNIRLFSRKPKNSSSANIRLILEPSCSFTISMKFSIFGALGQLARNYSSMLFTHIAVVVLLTFVAQLESLKTTGKCSIFFLAMKNGAKPYFILTTVKIVSKLFSVRVFENIFPKPEPLFLTNDFGLDFILVPILLYTIGVGIVWILAVLYSISLITLESTVHKLCLKVLAKSVTFSISWSDYLIQFLQKVPLFMVGTLIFLCVSTCGGLALCVGLVFYFLKLTQMSQDFIEQVVWFFVKSFAKKIKNKLGRPRKNHSMNNDKKQKEITNEIEPKHEQTSVQNKNNESNIKEENSKNDKAKLEQIDDAKNKQDSTSQENHKDIVNATEDKKIIKKSSLKEHTTIASNEINKTQTDVQNNTEEQNQTIETNTNGDATEDKKIINKSSLEEHTSIASNEINKTQTDVQNKAEEQNQTIETNTNGDNFLLGYNEIFFHCTLFFIWFLITLLNVPAVLTWAHNFSYSKKLSPDESFFPGIILSICAFPLWHFDFPKTNRKYVDKLQKFIQSVSVISLMYAIHSVYILNYLLTATFALVILHQLFAPKINDLISDGIETDSKRNDIKSSQQKYEDIKKKIE